MLLDVLAVIALGVGQTEQALLQNRIAAVPQRQRQAHQLFGIGECRRCHPRPSDRRGCARDRGGSIPRPCRPGCNPRAPCPTGVRSGRDPSDASHHGRAHWRAGACARCSSANSLSLRDLALEVNPGTQYLSDAPGLRETAARTVRCVTIKYLAHRPQAGAVQVLRHGLEKGLRQPRIAVARDSGPGRRVRAARPRRCPCGRPHRVAGHRRGSGRCSPDPSRSSCAVRSWSEARGRNNRPRPASVQGSSGSRAARPPRSGSAVCARRRALPPSTSITSYRHARSSFQKRPKLEPARCEQGLAEALLAGIAHLRGEADGDVQGVQPQRVDFHRLADARSEHLIAVLGVHPGELRAGLAGVQQAVGRIDVNAVAGALRRARE